MTVPLTPSATPADAARGSDGPAGGWTNPRGGYLFFAGFAAIGAGMGSLTPAVLTVALKAQLIDPANATTIVSMVAGIAGLSGLIAFPVLGRLSDRTTSRLGRRRPFLILGSLLFALGGILLLAATTVPVLIIGDVLTAVGFSSTMVAVTATIADQVEPRRRGPVSALVGLSLPLGAVLGLFIAQAVSPNLSLEIALPALFAVVGSALLAARLTDRRLRAEERPHFGLAQLLQTFWVSPFKSPNFALAWISRFLIFFGVSAMQVYQVFYLTDELGFTRATAPQAVFLTTLVLTGCALLFASVAAKISDRLGRRKPFVAVSALVFGIGLVMAAQSQTFTAFIIASAVVGVGQGVYFAVDVALVTEVLPNVKDTAKDLGLMNLANTLPLAVVPALAPVILAIGASDAVPRNYEALFLSGAFAGILGALFILPIRRVR